MSLSFEYDGEDGGDDDADDVFVEVDVGDDGNIRSIAALSSRTLSGR